MSFIRPPICRTTVPVPTPMDTVIGTADPNRPDHPARPEPVDSANLATSGVPPLPGSTRAVLLLCAQACLTVVVRPVRGRTGSGFVGWLLDEDPAAGFGFLVLDARGRVLALQLFDGPADRRLRPDPMMRAEASAGTFRATVTAVVAYRRRRTGSHDAAAVAAAPGRHPDLRPTIARG